MDGNLVVVVVLVENINLISFPDTEGIWILMIMMMMLTMMVVVIVMMIVIVMLIGDGKERGLRLS